MKPIRGINRNIHPADLPEGFYSFAKNITQTSNTGAVENENGFLYSQINSANYGVYINMGYKPVLTIETKLYVVIGLTNNITSLLGAYYEDTDTFELLYNDGSKPKLGLHQDFPAKGVWYENFLGEMVIAFTDNNTKPKVINLGRVAEIEEDKDILLFPEFRQPSATFSIENGGILKSGSYTFYVQYENTDGTTTDWSLPIGPAYIGEDLQTNAYTDFDGVGTGVITNKLVKLTFTNVDTAYDKMNIAVKTMNQGNQSQVFTKIISRDVTQNPIDIYITGQEQATVITPEEVLIKAEAYVKAKAITTLNSQLFLGNLQTDSSINLQPYINNIKVKWVTEEATAANSKLARYSIPKSFAHNEVYGLYFIGITKQGKVTQSFHIPGRPPRPIVVGGKSFNENDRIADIGATGTTDYLAEDLTLSANARYHQTRDTCTWNVGTLRGEMSYWENDSEFYPNTSDWDSSAIGGPDLRGQKVRHHKFPSFSFVKDNLYASDNQYGLSKMDRLGIVLEDISLPQDLADKLEYYVIGFAKRSFSNSLVISHETTVFCGFNRQVYDSDNDLNPNSWGTRPDWCPIAIGYNTESVKHHSGSNYKQQWAIQYGSNIGQSGSGAGFEASANYGDSVNFFLLKAHSAEINKLKPSLTGTYISTQLKYANTPFINYDEVTNAGAKRVSYFNDLVNSSFAACRSVGETSRISRIQDFEYVPENIVAGTKLASTLVNKSEQGALLKVRKFVSVQLNDADESINNENINVKHFGKQNSYGVATNRNVDGRMSTTINASGLDFSFGAAVGEGVLTPINDLHAVYGGYFYSILRYSPNCYTGFEQQDVISTGQLVPITSTGTSVFGGDCFQDIYSFHSTTCFTDTPSRTAPIDATGANANFKAQYNMFTESALNVGLRAGHYKVYPRDSSYLRNIPAGTPHNIDINSDYNTLTEPLTNAVFSTSRNFTNRFPHRIIKSLPVTTESKVVQWKQFLPLDYYEINKSKGVIINLDSKLDQLFIHAERALFHTRDKSRINTDNFQIQLTSGDLFDFPPIEIKPATNGYTGTQHQHSCLLTSEGYVWVDAEQGKVFLFNDRLQEISMNGLTNFFKENLGLFGDNPYNGDGITVTFDSKDKRIIILSVKNRDKEYTLSYCPEINQGNGGWVSFHDYVADYLFSTRKNTFSFKDGYLYRHNHTSKGVYYDSTRYSSYIDTVFNTPTTVNLNNINWVTDYSVNNLTNYYKTLTSISVWNQHQHSGKVELTNDQLCIANDYNSRNAESQWFFNTFRDIVVDRSSPFIQNLFSNFEPVSTNINITKAWFDKPIMNNKWFIVRLEFDNIDDATLQLLDVNINANQSYR